MIEGQKRTGGQFEKMLELLVNYATPGRRFLLRRFSLAAARLLSIPEAAGLKIENVKHVWYLQSEIELNTDPIRGGKVVVSGDAQAWSRSVCDSSVVSFKTIWGHDLMSKISKYTAMYKNSVFTIFLWILTIAALLLGY